MAIHAPIYSTYEDHYLELDCFRQIYEPLWYDAGVDLVLSGHVHAVGPKLPLKHIFYPFSVSHVLLHCTAVLRICVLGGGGGVRGKILPVTYSGSGEVLVHGKGLNVVGEVA